MSENAKHLFGETPWYWSRVNLFEGVDPEAQADFRKQATRYDIRPRAKIFSADEIADRVFILESGFVKIYDLTASGDVNIFWLCAPGDLFGAGGITGSRHQAVNAESMTRCSVQVILRPAFEALIMQHPRVGLNVIKLMGARLRLASDSISDKKTRRIEDRLIRVLHLLAAQCGKDTEHGKLIDVPITHQELGDMVGATRQTVNQTLKKLEKEGLVNFEGRRLVLTCECLSSTGA